MSLRDLLLNVTYTENGALTFQSTLSPVLDFYYHAPAKRGQDMEILSFFQKAYADQPGLAVLAMFNLRDVRGGKGERRAFRTCLRWLAEEDPDVFNLIAPFVPEYGRWDDLTIMVDLPLVREIVTKQLEKDCHSSHPSLLAKWMPSLKTSSAETRQRAHAWRKALNMSEQQYRRILSALRNKLRVTECDMSANRWGNINYSAVPSRAAILYRQAFARRDPQRYQDYLKRVLQGEAKINAGTLYPYEIVAAARSEYDETVQALWNALQDYTQNKVGLVVADVSGSMESQYLFRSKARAIDVSVSLAIYYAQRNSGPWSGMAISFTDRPDVISLPRDLPLDQAIQRICHHIGYNTNFQAIFHLILKIAKDNKISPEDMPAAIWVISDMEFDMAEQGKTNLEVVRNVYQEAGYTMPTLIFWNVASRNPQTPATMNNQGVALVSGFSPSIFQAALENRLITPQEAMLDVLLSPRYAKVAQKLGLSVARNNEQDTRENSSTDDDEKSLPMCH